MVFKLPRLTLGHLLALGALFAFAVYQYLQIRSLEDYISRSQEDLKVQMQSFNRDLGRAQTSFASSHAALNQLVRAVPAAIKHDLDRMNADIAALARFRVSSSSAGKGRVKPPAPPPSGSASSCNWSFSDWRLKADYVGGCGDGSFTYILDQSYEGLFLEGEASQGSSHYFKIWEIGPTGAPMEPPLVLNDFTVVKKSEPEASWQLPSIHLDLGLGSDLSPSGELSVSPHVGLSFLGYGKTKDDLSWRFARVAVSPLDDAIGLGVCPFSYNLGKDLPLFSNIWLSPCYLYRAEHSASLQLSGVL